MSAVISPYDSHSHLKHPPEGLLAQVDEDHQLYIAGTEPSMRRCAQKAKQMQYKKSSGFSYFGRFRGTMFRQAWLPVLVMTAISVAVVVVNKYVCDCVQMEEHVHRFTLIPIGFLLVFRSSQSYQRWWQGRGLIGGLLFSLRCMAIKSMNYLEPRAGEEGEAVLAAHCTQVSRLALAFIIATRHALQRAGCDAGLSDHQLGAMNSLRAWELSHYVSDVSGVELNDLHSCGASPPVLIAHALLEHMSAPCDDKRAARGLGAGGQLRYKWETAAEEVTKHVSDALKHLQGMRTIVNTPMPMPYLHCLDVFLYVWVATLPLVLVNDTIDLGWITIPIIGIIAIMLIGINAVGEEIEDPFGNDVNDFDLVRCQVGMHSELATLANIRFKGAAERVRHLWLHSDSAAEGVQPVVEAEG